MGENVQAGVEVFSGAHLVLSRGYIEGARDYAIYNAGDGTNTASIFDLYVEDSSVVFAMVDGDLHAERIAARHLTKGVAALSQDVAAATFQIDDLYYGQSPNALGDALFLRERSKAKSIDS